jgi:hypothetical protein
VPSQNIEPAISSSAIGFYRFVASATAHSKSVSAFPCALVAPGFWLLAPLKVRFAPAARNNFRCSFLT